jgi:osmotically-inducible protein OsmY
MRQRLTGSLLAALGLLGAGCSTRDADQLGRVARAVAYRLDNLTGGAQEKLANGFQAARASWSEGTPEAHVADRLRWDKQLAATDVFVDSLSPGVVRLQGAIENPELRRRVVDLAQNTLGVDRVVDEMTPSGE